MSFFGKNYVCYKQENFDGFLKFVGVPDDKVHELSSFTPSQKLVQNGDTYTYYTSHPGGVNESTFKSGEEVDEVIGPQKKQVKATYTVDGNVVTQHLKSDKGEVTFKREYNGDELVVTITAKGWDGVATRYYKA